MQQIFLLNLCIFFSFSLFSNQDFEKTLQDFEKKIIQEQQLWGVPGLAVGIVEDGKIRYLKGFGTRGINDTRPVDTETLFQIGSLSKAFTTTLTGILVDEHLLKWDDSVFEHMRAFALYDPWVTRAFQIEDLYAQRSGLPAYAGDLQVFLGYTIDDLINNLYLFKPASSFRSTYAYQNSFFSVGSKILEKKTGKTFHDLLEEKIFKPLKMTSSSVSLEDYLASKNRAEWIYRNSKGLYLQLPFEFPYNDWNYQFSAAGGINSTLKDMSHWLAFLSNNGEFEGKQWISKENLKKTQRPMVYIGSPWGPPLYYCEGWVLMENSPNPIIFHDGSTLGVYNALGFVPEDKVGIVVLSNGRGTNLSLVLILEFFDLYYGKPSKNWSEQFLTKDKNHILSETIRYTPQSLEPYIGEYTHPVYGVASITQFQNQLSLSMGKKPITFQLNALAEDFFSFIWEPYQEEPVKVVFNRNLEGKVSKMSIDTITTDGSGDFVKGEL